MQKTVLNFSDKSDSINWQIVNDMVMGGKSLGQFEINHQEGIGTFFGSVSTANNGGFSQVRFILNQVSVHGFSHLVLYAKGDGKRYQIRIREYLETSHAYIAYFDTTTDWKSIRIPLKEMYPTFRGRKLNISNFNGQTIEELGILIGNKCDESFHLLIDKIGLE